MSKNMAVSAIRPAATKDSKDKKKEAQTNGMSKPQERAPYTPPPISGVAPLKLHGPEGGVADLQLLTPEEKELCGIIRASPKAYLAMKDAVLREAIKAGGSLKRKQVREMCKVC